MKRVKDLMQDLGFREGGSDSVKTAFIKNLCKSAYGTPPQQVDEKPTDQSNKSESQHEVDLKRSPRESNIKRATKQKAKPNSQQLAFDLGPESHSKNRDELRSNLPEAQPHLQKKISS